MTHEADDVRRQLDRLREQGYDEIIEDYSDTIEAFMEKVVEENITAALNLTLQERLTGDREQDVTAVFITGLIFGAALERDVPMDSDIEEAWKEGDIELPE